MQSHDCPAVSCTVHGAACGVPRRVFKLACNEKVSSPWGIETGELQIFACCRAGVRFRPAPPPSRLEEFYRAPYHVSMEGAVNPARALGARRENDARIRYLRRFVPRGRVLDVGCSTGLLAAQLEAAGYEVEASDISAYACARTQELLPGRAVHCGAIPEYSGMMTERFDAITLMDVIEHLSDVSADLRSLRNMLRPGGHLFLRTPTLRSPFYRAAEWVFNLSGRRCYRPLLRVYHAEHLVFFDEHSIAEVLAEAGFVVEDIAPDPLLWDNFCAAEMQGSALENAALASIYIAGRLVGRGHGMRVMARC